VKGAIEMNKICVDFEEDILESMKALSKEMELQMEEVMKEIVKEGIIGLKKRIVKQKLESGEWTLRKAAKFLGVAFSEIVRLVEKEKIKLGKRPVI